MNFDFALILVVLTAISGMIWLLDSLFFRQKRRDQRVRQGGDPEHDPVAVEYARSLFPVLFAVLLFRSFLFEPFKIPSGSMIPTLLIGDFIVVNKFSYGLRLPVLNKKLVDLGEPEHGDVVVFRYPVDPAVNFIKRVVGLPGDTIAYRDKVLYLNGEAVATQGGSSYLSSEVKCSTPRPDAKRYRADMEGHRHDLLLHERMRARNGQWVVPEGHYFMMGDNRDRSNDSRAWGFVPEENLVGKAVGIWLNLDVNQGCADFSRIGDGIE